MSLSEFDVIERFFAKGPVSRRDVMHGIGDDGAVVQVPEGKELIITVDTLVAGVHFDEGATPESIGHKSLAVNLSDLAAMGAEPAWATLSLTIPNSDQGINEKWLSGFSRGLFNLAKQFNVQLIGGDMSSGPLSVTIQLHGFVSKGKAFRRDAARPGDLIYLTGSLGDAGLALSMLSGKHNIPKSDYSYLKSRLDYPQARINEALALQGIAKAAIDISDGLAADLGHMLDASNVGATVDIEKLPLSASFIKLKDNKLVCTDEQWLDIVISSGDDYELCFTVSAQHEDKLKQLGTDIPLTCIGTIEETRGLHFVKWDGKEFMPKRSGYEHFRPI